MQLPCVRFTLRRLMVVENSELRKVEPGLGLLIADSLGPMLVGVGLSPLLPDRVGRSAELAFGLVAMALFEG
jgi:hypothetical protein